MKFFLSALLFQQLHHLGHVAGFSTTSTLLKRSAPTYSDQGSALQVSIGLGPETKDDEQENKLVPGVDYEVPDHESSRTSRRSRLDEQCDKWFGSLLGESSDDGIMGSLAIEARELLTTPVPLVNEVSFLSS